MTLGLQQSVTLSQVMVRERRHTYTLHLSVCFTHQGYGQVAVITCDNYEVLAELTSVADAVWMWATHEATLEEWDLAGLA